MAASNDCKDKQIFHTTFFRMFNKKLEKSNNQKKQKNQQQTNHPVSVFNIVFKVMLKITAVSIWNSS